MSGGPGGRRRAGLLPAAVSVLALATAGVLWSSGASSERVAGAPASAASSSLDAPSGATAEATSEAAASRREVAARGVPRRVVVDSLGIDAEVVPVRAEGATLDPPGDPRLLGWWTGGARAGAARGTALVTGHTVHAGDGAMDDLDRIRAGAEIEVRTAHGTVRYVARSVRVLGKAQLARRAPQLFDQDVGGRLVLVTCEDWDGAAYRSNVVVTATSTS